MAAERDSSKVDLKPERGACTLINVLTTKIRLRRRAIEAMLLNQPDDARHMEGLM